LGALLFISAKGHARFAFTQPRCMAAGAPLRNRPAVTTTMSTEPGGFAVPAARFLVPNLAVPRRAFALVFGSSCGSGCSG